MKSRKSLVRYAWLSVAAAISTMALKGLSYFLTHSVGLLSDALESGVNLAAALLAYWALSIAARPPDEDHAYGHGKAEYFSSGVEGTLIMIAALTVGSAGMRRLLNPQPITNLGVGLLISILASLINLGVAQVLKRAGRRFHSIALEADAQHLMTDVWTSAGVLVGVAGVILTGWQVLDPIIALAVAIHIAWAGFRLVHRSALGLLDTAVDSRHLKAIDEILEGYEARGITFHALRTRQAASLSFVSMHIQVPGEWTVKSGHDLAEEIEKSIQAALPRTAVFTHVEPREDPLSWSDEHTIRDLHIDPEEG